jgi:hypothetical protein
VSMAASSCGFGSIVVISLIYFPGISTFFWKAYLVSFRRPSSCL